MNKQIKVMICGIQGYSGQELLKLVTAHPHLQLVGILARKSKADLYKEAPDIAEANLPVYSLTDLNEQKTQIDILLLATPTQASIEIVATLKNKPFKMIDLSGAFRLPFDEFNQWHGIEHAVPELLNHVPYGLSPFAVDHIANNDIIANPGCYATCALMSLIPLLKQSVIDSQHIIIDAKSGVSGAGIKANSNLMFCEMAENFFPYKVGVHQHTPEINNAIKQFANKNTELTFTTHMLPVMRGISMSIYVKANAQLTSDKEIINAIEKTYSDTYKNYPLVKFGKIQDGLSKKEKLLLSIKAVIGTPKTHIAYFVKDGKIIIFSSIDNLLKGAASQAIENINAIYHMPLEMGLLKEKIL